MRTNRVLLVLAAAFMFLLAGCNFGGQGADFDPTQYYTKTDISNWMAGALPSTASTHNLYASVTTSNIDYSSGATLLGAIPTGALGAFVKVYNISASTILYLGSSAVDHDSYFLDNASDHLIYVHFPATTGLKWWANTSVANLKVEGVLFIFDQTNGKP